MEFPPAPPPLIKHLPPYARLSPYQNSPPYPRVSQASKVELRVKGRTT